MRLALPAAALFAVTQPGPALAPGQKSNLQICRGAVAVACRQVSLSARRRVTELLPKKRDRLSDVCACVGKGPNM